MKQIITKNTRFVLSLILILLLSTGCRTVKLANYDLPDPNPIGLPRLLAEVDIPNMQYEAVSRDSVLMGDVMVTKVYNHSDTTMDFLPLVEIFPARVYEIVELYGTDVNNNINGTDTIPYGIIKLEILGFEEVDNKPLKFLSAWTLCLTCVLGIPMTHTTTSMELRVSIVDGQNNLIKRYYGTGAGKAYMAFYWGYGKDLKKKSNLLAYEEAMGSIMEMLRNDQDFLQSKLTGKLDL
jgi:hypothetical protein